MERGSGGEDQYRRGCRPGVDELLRDRLHAEVESLQRARAKQREVARLTEDDIIPRSLSCYGDHDDTGPALEHSPVRLAEPPLIVARDVQRLEHLRRYPTQLGTRVDQDRPERSFLARPGRVLELDVNAKRPHIVWHSSP